MTKIIDIQFKNGQAIVFYENEKTTGCVVIDQGSTIYEMMYAVKIDSE